MEVKPGTEIPPHPQKRLWPLAEDHKRTAKDKQVQRLKLICDTHTMNELMCKMNTQTV